MDAMLITKNGRKLITFESTDTQTRTKELKELVGCDALDVIYISDKIIGWVDDEGLFKNGNTIQTIVYVQDNQVVYTNKIAGNIVITSHDGAGNTIGLTDEMKKDLNINLRIVI